MSSRQGLLAGFFAYFFWGLFPLYWKPLSHVPAIEILGHRMVWSLVFVAVVLFWMKDVKRTFSLLKAPGIAKTFLLSSLLLATNWGLYIWAVNEGMILECSLGYFMNPLVNILLGAVFLKERLRPLQKIAVLIATLGVVWMTFHLGKLPWVALILALSFGFYGLIRKTAKLNSLEGLSVETLLLAGPALIFLLSLEWLGKGSFGHIPAYQSWMLAGAGIVTAVPLLLFAIGARRLPLSTMGILQYLSPSIQFGLGVWLYHEPFDHVRFMGFIAIWTALAIYTLEGVYRQARAQFA